MNHSTESKHLCDPVTNDWLELVKEEFATKLQSTKGNEKNGKWIMLMGDLNAKSGWKNMGYEERQTWGNEEKMRSIHLFFGGNQHVIRGSVFPHTQIHKALWVS